MSDHFDEPAELHESAMNAALDQHTAETQAALLRLAAKYGIRDDSESEPVWMLVRAVADAERAASGAASVIDAIERACKTLEALPPQIASASGEATRRIETDLSNWGAAAANIIAGRLKTMMIDLMPEVEKNAAFSINRLAIVADDISKKVDSVNTEMRSAFVSARGQYSDDLASSARSLIETGLIKEERQEHRKSLLHNAVALLIAATIGAGLLFGFMVYEGQYSPLPVFRVSKTEYDLLPTSKYDLSIQKCGGQPCILIEHTK